MNNTSLHDELDAPIKADIETLRKERKVTSEADGFLMNHILGSLSKNFENTAKKKGNCSPPMQVPITPQQFQS